MAEGLNDDPEFVSRGSQGIAVWRIGHDHQAQVSKDIFYTSDSRAMIWNPDGSQLMFATTESIIICAYPSFTVEHQLNYPNARQLAYSPLGSYMLLWQPYVVPHGGAGKPNLHVFTKNGEHVAEYYQKKIDNWCPQWSDDELVCARNVTNEVHFFEGGQFPTARLQHENLMAFALSHGPPPYHVAVHIKGTKGAPSIVQLYCYPQLNGPGAVVANKSFYKADTVVMKWDVKGKGVLVLTGTDIDKSGASYYGEQSLYYLTVKGEGFRVPLDKNGPIYAVEWSPVAFEFCVVYGFMPSKAALFNSKCELVFDFGITHRNTVLYNPHGNILCLAGFGNLRGNMEFWNVVSHTLVSKAQASDSTTLSWSPDGTRVITATTAPRLREGNGFKIWHFTGVLLTENATPSSHELWEVIWRPCALEKYPCPDPLSPPPHGLSVSKPAVAKPKAYIPPALRGKPLPIKKEEKDCTEPMSKTASKNKKKRDTRKAKQEQIHKTEQQNVVESISYHLKPSEMSSPSMGGDDQRDKRLKALTKKLKQIELLKEQLTEGKSLEANQVEKIKLEQSVIEEIARLKLNG